MNTAEILCRVGDLPEDGVCQVGTGLIAWRRGAEVRVFANSYFRFPDGACVGGPGEGRPLEPVAVRIEGGLVYLA